MTSPARLDRRALRERRQLLTDRLNYASWGAIVGGIGGVLFALVALFDTELGWQASVSLLMAAGMQFLLAYQVRRRHEIAAGSMVIGYILSLAWRWSYVGNFRGILGAGILLTVYVRGFLAAIDLAELDKEYGPESPPPAAIPSDMP